jgi:hypothetical protein
MVHIIAIVTIFLGILYILGLNEPF